MAMVSPDDGDLSDRSQSSLKSTSLRDDRVARRPQCMQTTARNVAVDDIQVHVEERGSGQPLLLLHGLTGSGGDFAHVFDLDALGSDYRVIAPDARGHGRSTNP